MLPPLSPSHVLRASLLAAAAQTVIAIATAHPASAQQPTEATRASTVSRPGAVTDPRTATGSPFDDLFEDPQARAIPRDDPSLDPEEADPLDPSRPGAGQRQVPRDGDLSWPPAPAEVRDGIVDNREPEPVQDGVDPLTVDTRDPADIDAFENPPAGYDPLLFQIEDIEPVADRRVARLARIEPYDPIGIRMGSFVLFPEVETGSSYYSNVLRSSIADPDVALDVKPSARLVSDWKRHALELRGSSLLSFHNEFESEDDRAYALEARGRLDFTRRTNVQAFVSRDVAQESRSAIDANAVGDRATLTRDAAGVSFQHRFNRLTVQLRGAVSDYSYSDVDVNGVTQSNADRNYTQSDEAVRATWEFKPTLSAFTEIETNQRTFDQVARADGITRDSDGQRYRVGVAFGSTGQTLRGEASLGYGRQTPKDAQLEDIDGILIDANVAWRMTPLTTLRFTARTDIAETTTAGSGGVFTRQAGVEARHAFRTHLIGNAGITYTIQDYSGIAITETEWRGDLGLEYFLSREAIVFGRYRHTMFDSTSPGASFDGDEVHVGVRLRR